jgi:hypothetical protein
MRELTMQELEAQLAEQLPARELMGGYASSGCQPGCAPPPPPCCPPPPCLDVSISICVHL